MSNEALFAVGGGSRIVLSRRRGHGGRLQTYIPIMTFFFVVATLRYENIRSFSSACL